MRLRLLLAIALAFVALPASASATRTTSTIFHAYSPGGTTTSIPVSRAVSGYCWTGSITIARSDAWRCFVGNYIYDPCFSSSDLPGVVACPTVYLKNELLIHLTRSLPYSRGDRHAPSVRDQPWNIELTSGRHYALSSGATSVVDGRPLLYFCGPGCPQAGLWGLPDRAVEPWNIFYAPFTATTLTERLAIRHAWM